MTKELITIGQIVAAHGNKGEVKVYPLTDFPNRFEHLKQVVCQLKHGTITLTIVSVRYHKELILLQFHEIDDISKAESLIMGLLKIGHEELMPLPEDHYYIFQLLGLDVFTIQGEYLGVISDIQKTGSNDVYVILHPETGKEILIPALKQFVTVIDLPRRKILVEPIPGLID